MLVFLDIDGVICLGRGINTNCLNNLKLFLKSINHKVVLSSTRRALDGVCEQISCLLEERDTIDRLDLGSNNDKSKLIKQYLESNKCNFENYIIIDDNVSIYSEDDIKHMIICNSHEGFTDNKRKEAMSLASKLI